MKLSQAYFSYISENTDGRWHPYNILNAFLAMFILGIILNAIPIIGFYRELKQNDSSVASLFVVFLTVILLIQLCFVMFFYNPERVIKYRKLQAFILPFFLFKVALDPLIFYWFICMDYNLSFGFYAMGALILLISCILFFFRTIEIIKKLFRGDLKKDGKGLYEIKSFVWSGGSSFIFGITSIGIAIPQVTVGTSAEGISFALTMLVGSLGLSIPIMYAIPETILLSYYLNRYTK